MHSLVLVSFLVLAACMRPAEPAADAPAPSRGMPAAELTAQDTVLRARVGEEFAIMLQSNPSTGYRWMLADSLDESMLRLASQTYIADPAPPGQRPAPGSGGRERWTFRALAPGETTIWLRYARSAPAPEARSAVFRVVIRPAAQ